MKILLTYTLVGRGGDAIQVQELSDGFGQLGHDVHLLGPHRLQPYEFFGRGGRLRSWLRDFPWWAKDLFEIGLNLLSLRQAQRYLRRERVDLIFHRAGIYDFVGSRLAAHAPLVVHLDAPHPLERAFRGEGHYQHLHQRVMRKLGGQARFIVTVSEAAKQYYAQLGMPVEKILIVPNGISQAFLQKGLQGTKARPPLAHGPPWTLGFVGSLSRWHRVDLLLEALHLLNSEHGARFQLIAVGYGEEYGNLRSQVKQLALESQVKWLGPLPHGQAFEQIAQFDIAVLPHTLTTGSPLKLFEYAAWARPIVAPDLTNLRELFSTEEMCYIQPERPQALAQAILSLCQNPEAARRTGERAQARVQGYSWEQMLSKLLETLSAAI